MTTHLNHVTQNQQINDQQQSDVSLHSASPTGWGFEELVPSRYALRVGEIDVLVVSDGVLPLPTSTMSTNASPADRAARFKEMYLGPDAFDWALNVLVVRSGEQLILVDAGLGGQFPGFPRAGQLPNDWKPPVSIWRP